jgi:hypothetical protein
MSSRLQCAGYEYKGELSGHGRPDLRKMHAQASPDPFADSQWHCSVPEVAHMHAAHAQRGAAQGVPPAATPQAFPAAEEQLSSGGAEDFMEGMLRNGMIAFAAISEAIVDLQHEIQSMVRSCGH